MLNFGDPESAPNEALFEALARAEDRVSRLDERAKWCGFQKGWRSRADIRAALAAAWLDGYVVHPEDLILHDLGMDARVPEIEVVKALTVLRARRKAMGDTSALLSWRGVLWLLGRAQTPPSAPRPTLKVGASPRLGALYEALDQYLLKLTRGNDEDRRAGVEDCLAAFDVAGSGVSVVLLAALFLEAWRVVDPLPAQRWVGPLLAAMWLLAEHRFTAGILPIEVGLRRRGQMPARLAWGQSGERIAWWLEGLCLACDLESEEVVRLKAKSAALATQVAGRRAHSRARALGALAMDQPVISTPIIAGSLKITPQAARQLVASFGGVLQEITGRSRYQAWRL